jgi:hypothetical protein
VSRNLGATARALPTFQLMWSARGRKIQSTIGKEKPEMKENHGNDR